MPLLNPSAVQATVKEALDKGIVQIMVNTTRPGVKLPAHLQGHTGVPLNLSWRFKSPLNLTEEGIFTELSFNQKSEPVMIPWNSIWLLKDLDQNVVLFSDMVPPEIKRQPVFKMTCHDGMGETTPPRTGHLRLLN